MARDYKADDFVNKLLVRRHNVVVGCVGATIAAQLVCVLPVGGNLTASSLFLLTGLIPCVSAFLITMVLSTHRWMERERKKESARRGGKPVLGMPPQRKAFDEAIGLCRKNGKSMIDRYLVGFELESGAPMWVTDDEICSHGAVFAKTGVGKTLWLEGLMVQQMGRARASGLTFIDAKRDPGTLADIIMMALLTGRIEDLIVVDPFDPVCSYNFVFTTQRADVKARKVLRCGLPPTTDQSTTKHYDRLAADAVYRVVRCMESLGLAWSVRDIAVALSAFTVAYPRLRELLHEQSAKSAMVELGHLAGSYRTAKGGLDSARLTDNLRGIASELHSIANSEAGEMFCVPRADLSLTDAILRGKIIYYMLPRLEEAESAARMVKVFREDLEVSIGEVTSSRMHHLEDPHLVIIDEGASTFGPTWANLFELARKGRFALLFGAQSIGGLMDQQMGLSQEFYDRVIANVNLKVIMRLGDNRTAEDMSDWIGMVNIEKKTIATGMSSSLNARELTKHIEMNKRTADGFRDGFTFSEDEKELVSTEELKHEMSAEKGLAWFDKGDGRIRKGRAIWFDGDLPATWEGREFLTRYETVEADEIGLAEWVDEHILLTERAETQRSLDHESRESSGPGGSHSGPPHGSYAGSKDPVYPGPSGGAPAAPADADAPEAAGGGFRLNPMRGFRGMGRARVTVMETPKPVETKAPATPAAQPAAEKAPADKGPDKVTEKAPEKAAEKAADKPAEAPKHTAKPKAEAPPRFAGQVEKVAVNAPAGNPTPADGPPPSSPVPAAQPPAETKASAPASAPAGNAGPAKFNLRGNTTVVQSPAPPRQPSAKPAGQNQSAQSTAPHAAATATGEKATDPKGNTEERSANNNGDGETDAQGNSSGKKRRRRRRGGKGKEETTSDTPSSHVAEAKAGSEGKMVFQGGKRDVVISNVKPPKFLN